MILAKVVGTVVTTLSHPDFKNRRLLVVQPLGLAGEGADEDFIALDNTQAGIGDTVLVRPGERFPIDGEVTGGSSAVDQSTITGESIPVEKAIRDSVFAGTVNGNGALEVRVTRLAQDTALAKIVQMVEDALKARGLA